MLDRIRDMSYVILLCDDTALMKQFYSEVMRFSIYRDWPGWTEFRVGSTLLTLRRRGRPYDGSGPTGAAIQLAFRVAPDEVESCYEELLEKGVEILEPVTVQDFGHKTLFFRDPEGNILEIYADIPVSSSDNILSRLSLEQVLEISPHCNLQNYQPGEIIVQQGDEADKFFVITQGRVQVINRTPEGHDLHIGWLHEGDYFGEVGLLQSHPRTATIRAASDNEVKVIAIDRQGFSELMHESPEAGSNISKAMFDRLMEMAGKIIAASDK